MTQNDLCEVDNCRSVSHINMLHTPEKIVEVCEHVLWKIVDTTNEGFCYVHTVTCKVVDSHKHCYMTNSWHAPILLH